MLEVINYLKQTSDQGVILDNGKILFQFGNFEILLHSNDLIRNDNLDEDGVDEDFYNCNIADVNSASLAKVKFDKVSVCSSEYVEWRDEQENPTSLSLKMYNFIFTFKRYANDIIESFGLLENYGYDDVDPMYCGGGPNYVFEITIKRKFWTDLTFFEHIVQQCSSTDGELMKPIYKAAFQNKHLYADDNELKIITTNTKARRLGYLTLISHFLAQRKQIPKHLINRKFEDFAEGYYSQLKNYWNDKGQISKSKTGISAKPYIDLALNLRLIQIISERVSGTKKLKVYHNLSLNLDVGHENIFYLTGLDKLFFIELIIEHDFLYIHCLLELIYLNGTISYKELAQVFQGHLLQRLRYYEVYLRGDPKLRDLRDVFDRIKTWEEPITYLEHVLMPRINWLLDLQLLTLDKSLNTTLTSEGKILFINLCLWIDINHGLVINPKSFLDSFAVHLYASVYNGNDEPNLISENEIKSAIEEYLKQSFSHFKTLAPNRVTASQAISFTKFYLFFDKNIKVGYSYILRLLQENQFPQFIFKFQPKANDGYIQLINLKV